MVCNVLILSGLSWPRSLDFVVCEETTAELVCPDISLPISAVSIQILQVTGQKEGVSMKTLIAVNHMLLQGLLTEFDITSYPTSGPECVDS